VEGSRVTVDEAARTPSAAAAAVAASGSRQPASNTTTYPLTSSFQGYTSMAGAGASLPLLASLSLSL